MGRRNTRNLNMPPHMHPRTQRSGKVMEGLWLRPVGEVFLDEASVARFRAGYRDLFGNAAAEDPLYASISAGRRHPAPLRPLRRGHHHVRWRHPPRPRPRLRGVQRRRGRRLRGPNVDPVGRRRLPGRRSLRICCSRPAEIVRPKSLPVYPRRGFGSCLLSKSSSVSG